MQSCPVRERSSAPAEHLLQADPNAEAKIRQDVTDRSGCASREGSKETESANYPATTTARPWKRACRQFPALLVLKPGLDNRSLITRGVAQLWPFDRVV